MYVLVTVPSTVAKKGILLLFNTQKDGLFLRVLRFLFGFEFYNFLVGFGFQTIYSSDAVHLDALFSGHGSGH
jgi:hypothetical protein